MTVQTYLRVLLRWWWLVLLCLGLSVGGGVASQIYLGTMGVYEATTAVSLGTEVEGWDQSRSELTLAEDLVPTYVELAKRSPITDRVIETLDLSITAGELVENHLAVEQIEKTQLIEIRGKHTDPELAAAIANETARQLQLSAPMRPAGLIQIVFPAKVPTVTSLEPYLFIGLAGVVGLLLAGGIVLLIEFALDRPYTPEWAATRLDLPILGTFNRKLAPGRWRLLGKRKKASSIPTEPVWWVVMATLDRALNGSEGTAERGRSIVVTSPQSKESKTAAAVALAWAAAASGRRVVLVDADVRQSRLQRWFKLSEKEGVTSLARNGYTSHGAQELLVPAAIDGLTMLPAGPEPDEGSQLVHNRFWQTVLADLCSQADLVIVNGPAINAAPEAMAMVTNADGVLLTMDLGKTRAPLMNETTDILVRGGATILGVALNRK